MLSACTFIYICVALTKKKYHKKSYRRRICEGCGLIYLSEMLTVKKIMP